MLVRENWLRDVLNELDCILVIGRLGEKRMIGGSFERKPLPWLEINALAIYDGGEWRFTPVRADKHDPVGRWAKLRFDRSGVLRRASRTRVVPLARLPASSPCSFG